MSLHPKSPCGSCIHGRSLLGTGSSDIVAKYEQYQVKITSVYNGKIESSQVSIINKNTTLEQIQSKNKSSTDIAQSKNNSPTASDEEKNERKYQPHIIPCLSAYLISASRRKQQQQLQRKINRKYRHV